MGVGTLIGDLDDDVVRVFIPPRAEFLGTSVRPHPVGSWRPGPRDHTSRTGLARDLIPTWKRFAFGCGVRTNVKRQEPTLRGSRFQTPGVPFAQEG